MLFYECLFFFCIFYRILGFEFKFSPIYCLIKYYPKKLSKRFTISSFLSQTHNILLVWQKFIKMLKNLKAFENKLLSDYLLKSVSNNQAEFELFVSKKLCNNYGILHGGAIHLISEELGSLSIKHILKPSSIKTISSNISFLSSTKENNTLSIFTNFYDKSPNLLFSEINIYSNLILISKANYTFEYLK